MLRRHPLHAAISVARMQRSEIRDRPLIYRRIPEAAPRALSGLRFLNEQPERLADWLVGSLEKAGVATRDGGVAGRGIGRASLGSHSSHGYGHIMYAETRCQYGGVAVAQLESLPMLERHCASCVSSHSVGRRLER
mgnify:CR=1 FL=1